MPPCSPCSYPQLKFSRDPMAKTLRSDWSSCAFHLPQRPTLYPNKPFQFRVSPSIPPISPPCSLPSQEMAPPYTHHPGQNQTWESPLIPPFPLKPTCISQNAFFGEQWTMASVVRKLGKCCVPQSLNRFLIAGLLRTFKVLMYMWLYMKILLYAVFPQHVWLLNLFVRSSFQSWWKVLSLGNHAQHTIHFHPFRSLFMWSLPVRIITHNSP